MIRLQPALRPAPPAPPALVLKPAVGRTPLSRFLRKQAAATKGKPQ